jgi:hypothetical protein
MADAIIRELWDIKDRIASEFDYDVDALVAHLRAIGSKSGRPVVDLSLKKRATPTQPAASPPTRNQRSGKSTRPEKSARRGRC